MGVWKQYSSTAIISADISTETISTIQFNREVLSTIVRPGMHLLRSVRNRNLVPAGLGLVASIFSTKPALLMFSCTTAPPSSETYCWKGRCDHAISELFNFMLLACELVIRPKVIRRQETYSASLVTRRSVDLYIWQTIWGRVAKLQAHLVPYMVSM
jgi:hypothetical protein